MAWLLTVKKAISQRRPGASSKAGLESKPFAAIGTHPARHLKPQAGEAGHGLLKRRARGLFSIPRRSTAAGLGWPGAQGRTRREGGGISRPGPWRSQISCQQRSGTWGSSAARAIGEGRRGFVLDRSGPGPSLPAVACAWVSMMKRGQIAQLGREGCAASGSQVP